MSTPYPVSSSRSAPTTPGSNPPTSESAPGAPSNVMATYDQTGSTRSLRNDLLVAADSVTNAMSSLVRELNSGNLVHSVIINFTAFVRNFILKL